MEVIVLRPNLRSLSDNIIIDQSQRTKVRVQDDRAYLEPGCLLGPSQKALSPDLALVGGTCPNTCVAGLSLGGGIGFLMRKYGLTSDTMLEAEVLLASGELVRTNSENLPDLFWAIRGAGNQNFGIITEFVFQVFPVKKVVIFDLVFKFDNLKEVIKIWQEWAPFTTEDMSSELDVYSDHILVTGQFLGCTSKAKKLLKIFNHLQPETTIKRVKFIDAVRHFAGQGRWLPFFENKSGFVPKPFTDEAIDIIRKYMSNGGIEDHLELNAMGGYVNSISSKATAFVHRDSLFWCHIQSHWESQLANPEKMVWIQNFYDELRFAFKGAYINAPDRDLPHALKQYYGDNLHRLREIKTQYDPDYVFRYHQSIPPL